MNVEITIQYLFDNYPGIFKERADCLNQLFCSIGNGFYWQDGELIWKEIPDEEINTLLDWAKANCHEISLTEVWAKGGEGGEDLAHKVIRKIEQNDGMCHFHHLYDVNLSIKEKMNIIAREIYGADAVEYSPTANKQIKTFEENGWDKLPICVAKTQYSLSDNAKLLGRPHGFVVTVREFKPSIGAGFIVALMGDIMTMPGLPKVPASNAMDVIDNKIVGLF